MAALVRLTVDAPQNVIDTFAAGALIRLERGTNAAMSDAAEVTTVAVVAGTTEYEYKDATGVAGTHWYRSRYSIATPTLSTHYSGYGAVFQAGAPGGEVITLDGAKTWTKIQDTDDDGWLAMSVGAMNRAILRSVGVDIGPSPDTTRTFDGYASIYGRRLWVKGGIRAFTTVEVSADETTWTDISTAVRLGPADHPPGEPYSYIEVKPHATTSLLYAYVRVTGTAFATFGWDAYPADLAQAGYSALQRLATDRDGRGSFPTETDAMRYLNPATLEYYKRLYFPGVG